MIFQNRQYDFINRNRRIDMYAYNMSQKKYEWKIDSFTRTGNTSVFPILVKEDRLYFQGSIIDLYQINPSRQISYNFLC